IANAMTITLNDGTVLPELVVEYPIGHKRRRVDGIPLLEAKFRTNLARRFVEKRQRQILDVSLDQARLEAMPVHDYVDLYAN
ncbi:MAG: 2-methylcitrate dehydratase, partial [Sphingomonadaceae bacterium]